MEIKKAKLLVEDILDICTQLGEENLNDSCAGIYNDLNNSKSIEYVMNCAAELMIFVNDAPWESMEDGGELKNEIEIIYNQLLEEYSDL